MCGITCEIGFTEFISTCTKMWLQFVVVVLLSNTREQSRAMMIVSALRFDIAGRSESSRPLAKDQM